MRVKEQCCVVFSTQNEEVEASSESGSVELLG